MLSAAFSGYLYNNEQLLDEVFVISGIIQRSKRDKCYRPSRRPTLISQKPNLIIFFVIYIVLKKITTNTPSQGT